MNCNQEALEKGILDNVLIDFRRRGSHYECTTVSAIKEICERVIVFFYKNGPNPASFCLFSFFSHGKYSTNLTINDRSIDGVLGTQTWGGRIVGADESPELWRQPKKQRNLPNKQK